MKLIHYSDQILTYEDLCSIDISLQKNHMEPKGLWVSDDDDENNWKSWCESENFNLHKLERAHRIHLNEYANVLVIESPEKLISFGEEHRKPICIQDDTIDNIILFLDWPKICSLYNGIIITPYQLDLSLVMEASWYYGWDCASGCIWNIDAIEGIEVIK